MATKPKPYVKGSWYCTSVGGVQHQKLCEVKKGLKAASLELARLMVRLGDSGGEVRTAPVKILTERVIDEFLTAKLADTDHLTFISYRDCLVRFREWFGAKAVSAITYEDGLKFKVWLSREAPFTRGKEQRKGLGNTRVNHCLRAAKTMFNWALKPSRRHKYGMMMNPWEEIKFLVERPRERLILPDEFRNLLEQCQEGAVSGAKADYREQLTVLRYTTMRPGELRKLKWDYIQWDKNRIVFPAEVIKTRRRRETVMIDVVKQVLLNRKARAEAKGIKLKGYVFGVPTTIDNKRLAVESGDRPQTANSFSQRFRRLFQRCVRLGLVEEERNGERICPYNTRHTRITELFVEGNEHHIVMFDAGHVVPATTERYKHLASSFVADTIRGRSQQASS